MKLKITQVILTGTIALGLMMPSSASFARNTTEKNPATKKKEARKSTKVSTSRNNSSVRIYPDIVKRVMHVVAKEDNEGEGIDFFVFSLEGTLVNHYKMKAGTHEKLAGLERGKYIFRVFAGDEETASGNFEIR
jgi:hypothetical protein